MRLRWTVPAIRDLAQHRRYIAKNNPHAAATIAKRILDAVNRLTAMPSLGRPGRLPGTRELLVAGTPYIVPYRVRDGYWIEILRVLDGRWQVPRDE